MRSDSDRIVITSTNCFDSFQLQFLFILLVGSLTYVPRKTSRHTCARDHPVQFRLEVTPVSAAPTCLRSGQREQWWRFKWWGIPLLKRVLRDTLGDTNKTNDFFSTNYGSLYLRLRQRAAALVPFLYRQVSNKGASRCRNCAAIIDLSKTEQETWKSLCCLGRD